MQVITAAIQEEAVLICEATGKLLVIRDGLEITVPVAVRLSEVLDTL